MDCGILVKIMLRVPCMRRHPRAAAERGAGCKDYLKRLPILAYVFYGFDSPVTLAAGASISAN